MSAVDDLLDAELDDLKDMPEFSVFPNGAHACTVKSFGKIEINKDDYIELVLTAVSTEELSDPSDNPLVAGAEASSVFNMSNEFGQGSLKALLLPLRADLGVTKLGEVMEKLVGTTVLVVTKKTFSKDKTKTYMNVTNITVL